MTKYWGRHSISIMTCVFLISAANVTSAQTRGEIQLRGVVYPKASVDIHGLSESMSVDFSAAANGVASMTFGRLTNGSSGFNVRLGADSLSRNGVLALTANESTTSIPYQIRFQGQQISFVDDQADITNLARQQQRGEFGDTLEVIAPRAASDLTESYTDRLTLVVTSQ